MLAPMKSYTSEYARSLLLQMPLVSICIGNPETGRSFSILMEKFSGTDYSKIGSIINSLVNTIPPKETSLEKSVVKALLSVAQSDHERNCIRYAIYKTSGMSQTAIRRKYGFEQMQQHAASVEEAIVEIQNIRESINDLANIEEKALLLQCGVVLSESSSSSDSEEDSSVQEYNMLSIAKVPLNINPAYLKPLMSSSNYNFFDIVEATGTDTESDIDLLYEALLKVSKDPNEVQLLQESYMAYKCVRNDTCSYEQDRTARSLNGEIVTDSESDNPECYVGITDPMSDKAKHLIAKKCTAIRRRARRRKKKAIAERRFLSRKVSKRVNKILRDCPNIGEVIETFVQERNVGADAWRRTGVLTFDGNTKLKQKATYESIRQHLEVVYKRRFSFGSVIQLCMPRNKRRSSAKRYMGVARVTSRRARKGFTLKLNPDTHWSSSFYKGLNELQYVDGRDMFIVNRDDAAGFRLDTLTTCKQYTTPVVQGKNILTTHTDYVNKYPSVLQTTSYNFTATSKTGEVCVGVVKAPKVHEKNPAQHAGDLEMLESKEELHSVFFNESGCSKLVDCVRVDGASDEGPSHDEVQFWWTYRHLKLGKVATLVTTRSSGSSYRNRVELQNGCLSLGHANTFIPSTLGGSCLDPDTGKIDDEKLSNNMELAVDAYISRVNGAPCGSTVIQLFKGVKNSTQVMNRESLLVFLKGSKTDKEALKYSNPSLFEYFQNIWNIRCRHMVKGLPSQYCFMLLCCYNADCPHPVCKKGTPSPDYTWYSGGLSVKMLPLPVIDEERPWGSDCQVCKGKCCGHYKNVLINVCDSSALDTIALPPSTILKKEFNTTTFPFSDNFVQKAAKKAMLSPSDTSIWLEHLHSVVTNRKRGAAKAAATRRAKKTSASDCTSSVLVYHCGKCGKEFEEETESPEMWIGCDVCDAWYCGECENLSSPPESNLYVCSKCT